MIEYVVDFGDKSTAFVGLAMAEAESHGATLKEQVVRCRDCVHYTDDEMEYYHYCDSWCARVSPNGFCAWGRRDA